MKTVCPFCDHKVNLIPSDDFEEFVCPHCGKVIPFEKLEIDRKAIITINLETTISDLVFNALGSSDFKEFFEKLQKKIGKDLVTYIVFDWQLPSTTREEMWYFKRWKRWIDFWQSRNCIILEIVGHDKFGLYLAVKSWKAYLKILKLFHFLDVLSFNEII